MLRTRAGRGLTGLALLSTWLVAGCVRANGVPPGATGARIPGERISGTSSKEPSGSHAPPSMRAPWTVVYREPATLFEMVDNASGWSPDKNDEAYRKAWKERFGISPEDEAHLTRFAEIRKRTYVRSTSLAASRPDADGSDDLVGRGKAADELAFAFYGAEDLDRALAALPSSFAAADRVALGETFAALRKRLEPWLTESRSLEAAAGALSRALDAREVREQATMLGRFFGVDQSTPVTFAFVHGPPSDHTSAHKRGPFVLLEAKPTLAPEEAKHEVPVAFHELVHHLAEQTPAARRHAFSATFRAGCALPPRFAESGGARVLEEPLAVALQRVFERRVAPDKLDFSRPWYGGDPWVGTYAKLLYGLVQTTWDAGGVLDEALARRSARLCDGLLGAAKELSR